MGIIKEFKVFALKGNVMDMAIGIIIGAAFGKIVASLVSDVIMPPIGLLVGGVSFIDIKYTLRDAILDPSTGKILKEAVVLKIGSFLQALFDFLMVAFAIFMMIKALNRLNQKIVQAPIKPPAPTKEELLLTEIRDLLKENQKPE
ncbi:MAG: large-conductance mechanosensitive channel protein MscL [Bacteroidota bacterium]